MFENISSTLQQCGYFFVLGAIIGLFYEILRIFRMFIRHNSIALCAEDTIFLTLCGFISYIVSMAVGIGYFRIYYIVFEVFGAAFYFLTLGRLVNYIFRRISKIIILILSTIFGKIFCCLKKSIVPIAEKIRSIFDKFAKFIQKRKNINKKVLQKHNEMLYNNIQLDLRSENRNVIKAKIRKKT